MSLATMPGASSSLKYAPDTALFSLDHLQVRYEPFPIGFCPLVLDADLYQTLVANWPPNELFQHKPALGNKYSLSEVNHPQQYEKFVRESSCWSLVHRLIKSTEFVEYVLESLLDQNVDLGVRAKDLNTRFEFSMLAGDGGNIKPHTDAPNKLITLVVFIVGEGEWQSAWGGGTAVLKPKDPRRTYNQLNMQLEFEEVECLEEFPFDPNGCVVFVKTFNSYHAVYPNRAPHGVERRSLTINIEDLKHPSLAYFKTNRPRFRR